MNECWKDVNQIFRFSRFCNSEKSALVPIKIGPFHHKILLFRIDAHAVLSRTLIIKLFVISPDASLLRKILKNLSDGVRRCCT